MVEMKPRRATPKQRYARMAKMLLKDPKITQPKRKKGFGSSGLYTRGKLFAALSYRNRLILKLPEARVNEIVAQRKGTRWDPRGEGEGLKEWVTLSPSSKIRWLPLAKEAKKFVASKSRKR
jgi:hypothetical protein